MGPGEGLFRRRRTRLEPGWEHRWTDTPYRTKTKAPAPAPRPDRPVQVHQQPPPTAESPLPALPPLISTPSNPTGFQGGSRWTWSPWSPPGLSFLSSPESPETSGSSSTLTTRLGPKGNLNNAIIMAPLTAYWLPEVLIQRTWRQDEIKDIAKDLPDPTKDAVQFSEQMTRLVRQYKPSAAEIRHIMRCKLKLRWEDIEDTFDENLTWKPAGDGEYQPQFEQLLDRLK
ncbi:uncharacterized protein LOC131737578 [Acipenser ruthenus]|uniref:uncharacterized protein LOC131728554 n=1 Tax=Acipenser ruthenus TaxID=7906 RepID=UPI0027411FA7|nr:uncharacterized protein LOC131728554 [Acipenser ruthenus]XP_058877142.1 uncharacterized protein LOC131733197 [Acipenser ruthenus]XP_058883815.1 uncharacterized protein LOC131737578 [Acipenser ruthenus]